MERNAKLAAALTAVGIVALALSAATLPSTVSTENPAPEGSNASGEGFLPSSEDVQPGEFTPNVPGWLVAGVMLVGTALAVAYVLAKPNDAFSDIAVIVGGAVAFIVFLFFVSELFADLRGGGGAGSDLFGRDSGPSGSETTLTTVDPPLLLVAVGVGVVLLVAVAALYGATGDDTDDTTAGEPTADGGDDATAAEVGRAAGRAADRIEQAADVDNEVYRAWREMATLVDADRPQTSTPGEFAAAAAGAGIDRGDVEELTRLFEEVRYGDADVTADREREAVRTLRRIEETYTAEEPWA